MGAKKLTNSQTAKLAQLATVHGEIISARAFLRAEIEAAYQTKLRDLELRESRVMNEARVMGVPKTQIARTVGTSNWDTLETKYALTAAEFVDVVQHERVEVDRAASTFLVRWVESKGIRYELDATIPFRVGENGPMPSGSWDIPGLAEWVGAYRESDPQVLIEEMQEWTRILKEKLDS